MFKTSKIFGGLLAVGALAVAIGGGVSASAAPNPGPGNSSVNLSGNGTSVSDPEKVYEAVGSDAATAYSTAEFKVEGGRLLLIAVPDLNFGKVDGNLILSGGRKKLVNSAVETGKMSKDTTAFDGNSDGMLVISDGRDATGSWHVDLAMGSTFKAGTPTAPVSPDINGVKLDLDATPTNANPAHVIGNLHGVNIDDTAQTIVSATKGAGKTEFSFPADSAELIFPVGTNSDFAPEVYQSDLTWTLVTGA